MIQKITFTEFENAFKSYNRENQYPTGLRDLFNYLEELEEAMGGEQIELDVIAICTEYVEDTLNNVLSDYNLESLEELRDNTEVIMIDDEDEENPTIIYKSY
jgi:hypothetical protein